MDLRWAIGAVALWITGCAGPAAAERVREWPDRESERQYTEWSRVTAFEHVPGYDTPYAALLDLEAPELRERLGATFAAGNRADDGDLVHPEYSKMVWSGPCCMGEDFRVSVYLRPRRPGAKPMHFRSVVVSISRSCDGQEFTSDISGYVGPWRDASRRL